jgi:hypothetical protein
MGLHNMLFKDYIVSYLNKVDLDEKVPKVVHRTYHKNYIKILVEHHNQNP